MKSSLSRFLLVTHRYLGVVIGTLMTLWCLSGFVMMYQGFPSFTEAERLASAAPLDLSQPMRLDAVPLAPNEEMSRFRIEMVNGEPVLRQAGHSGGTAYSLKTGEPVAALTEKDVLGLASAFAASKNLIAPDPVLTLMRSHDQWTVQGFDPQQAIYKASLGDAAGTELYIAADSGAIIQDTNRQERVLSWLGAIPHWLYPTVLRENGPLWTQVVIWSSVLGIFLTATGLYVGIGRWLGPKKKRLSPYKGLWYWHHVTGLFFGILTLTWVFSGLMTMGPWGVLSSPPSTIRQDMTGTLYWKDVRAFLEAARQEGVPAGTRELNPAPLGGNTRFLAYDQRGSSIRLGATAKPEPLQESEVRAATQSLPVTTLSVLESDDAYYYGFKERAFEPAYRVEFGDPQQTVAYINASSGLVSRVVDNNGKAMRWLRNGLHSLDFLPRRPIWDAITIALLIGVTMVCATGTWMGFRRIRTDARKARKLAKKHPKARASFRPAL